MKVRVFRLSLLCIFSILFSITSQLSAQNRYELNSGWKCSPAEPVNAGGEAISLSGFDVSGWMNATVPGTVLTTLLDNGRVPDPFYGMNNEKIPDVYHTGRDHYTYWFVKDFSEKPVSEGEIVRLHLRGVNYGCDVFLNGVKLTEVTHYGMFLRQDYDISRLLNADGKNRLAVIVYPPDPPGDPNGGQGGDGTIGRNVSHQYAAGWDWIQPVRDRNTGIWDKVFIERSKLVKISDPHVVTRVPGKRLPAERQDPASVASSATIENPGSKAVKGTLRFSLNGITVNRKVTIPPGTAIEVKLPDLILENPQLWWPHGSGDQFLYDARFVFTGTSNTLLDAHKLKVGVREIGTRWNSHTRSMEILVNGQKLFIRGANWIISDAMLRFSQERYDAEIRFHRDMNLNLIRIWGGAITERPEFYDACDRYGLLVMQDFWMSGDCNGRWVDPMKKEDQWTRRQYPDDHRLFVRSVADQVRMIRNHPSLAFYCGGNEITPPEEIHLAIKDTLLPLLDGTRYYFSYSNSDSLSYNSIGGNGDGPYTIQPVENFWQKRSFPFNSEIGNVGTGDIESLRRFIPSANLIPPDFEKGFVDSVWKYHKYIGYNEFIDRYGKSVDAEDFAKKAQLVNFDQYRALIEGHCAYAWDWYTGVIIWKTQNPWTALRGQMYDYYLDPNAGLYGLSTAGKALHAMCNPADGMVMTINNSEKYHHDMMLQVKTFDMNGRERLLSQVFCEISPFSVQKYFKTRNTTDDLAGKEGLFLVIRLLDKDQNLLSDNLYWLPDSTGRYSGLQNMSECPVELSARRKSEGKIEVTVTNRAGNPVAFFNRISLVDAESKERILPVFYSDNYFSVLPGENKKTTLEYSPSSVKGGINVSIEGWNVGMKYVPVQ